MASKTKKLKKRARKIVDASTDPFNAFSLLVVAFRFQDKICDSLECLHRVFVKLVKNLHEAGAPNRM